tara:strand:- start:2772 stop:3023 length:252 start_codon:yes stop_codon:yes gene_type:complete
MKSLILACSIMLIPVGAVANSSFISFAALSAERGTAVGVAKSKGAARFKAQKNIPKGARQTGITKYVKNADGTWTVYVMWVKR